MSIIFLKNKIKYQFLSRVIVCFILDFSLHISSTGEVLGTAQWAGTNFTFFVEKEEEKCPQNRTLKTKHLRLRH